MTRNSISRYILRSAGEVKRFRIMMRVIPIVIAVLVALSSVVYVSSVMYNRYGSYTVTINKFDNLNYSISLTENLIEDPDTGKLIPAKAVARLNSKASEEIRDMDGDTLPEDIDERNGEHNGENFIAYTYYLFNNGEKILTYEYNLYIVNATKNVDKGVRVRLYVNGVPTTYARTRTRAPLGPEEGTVAFMGDSTIVKKSVTGFKPGDYTKFTIVIWIEGNDEDTTDDIIGGQFKVDMKINITGDENGTPIEFEEQKEQS